MKELNLIHLYNKRYMELTQDQLMEKYAKQCRHYSRSTILPYEY